MSDIDRFDIQPVGVHEIATCRLCGKEFIVSELSDAECCEALQALKEWADDGG